MFHKIKFGFQWILQKTFFVKKKIILVYFSILNRSVMKFYIYIYKLLKVLVVIKCVFYTILLISLPNLIKSGKDNINHIEKIKYISLDLALFFCCSQKI